MILQRYTRWSLGMVATMLLASSEGTRAQHITVDGRLSPAQTLNGPNYAIGANLGRTVGGNLFQSFGFFDLSKGETATFSGPPSVTNIIGRVTGGSVSKIDGTVSSTIKGANVYMINPSGLVFGPNAQVNVPGSFHASTADYLKMSNGKRFQASNPNTSTLTSAPPQAFGFLTASPKPIAVKGATLGSALGTLGLVGGRVAVTSAKLLAPAGAVQIVGVAGRGKVPVNPRTGPPSTVTHFAPVTISRGSTIDVSDSAQLGSGGSVFIRAGSLSINASEIDADNFGPGNGGRIVLQGEGLVDVAGGSSVHAYAASTGQGAGIEIKTASIGVVKIDASIIGVASVATGNSGAIAMTTGTLALRNKAEVLSGVADRGDGGTITINSHDVSLAGDALIDSTVFTTGAGAGGTIVINAAKNLDIDGSLAQSSGAAVGAATFGPGSGGSIAVSAQNIRLSTGGQISTGTFGSGASGSVQIAATGAVLVAGAKQSPLAQITEITADSGNFLLSASAPGNMGLGPAGSVAIDAQSVRLVGDASVTSAAYGDGNAGSITVDAVAGITIDGSLGQVIGARISAGTQGSGHGGSVVMTAQNINLLGGGTIDAAASGLGAPGTVQLAARGRLLLDGSTKNALDLATNISAGASTQASSGLGGGGAVNIAAQAIIIRGDADISSITTNGGRGGDVTIDVSGNMTIDGSLATSTGAFVTAETIGSGLGGSVNVKAKNLILLNTAEIDAATYGSGAGGIVHINTEGKVLLNGAGKYTLGSPTSIYADAYSVGKAGYISINAGYMDINSASISSNSLNSGFGGNVYIVVKRDLLVSNSANLTGAGILSETESTGNAGMITVRAAGINITQNGLVSSASLGTGAAGDVVIDSWGRINLANFGGITSQTSAVTRGNAGSIAINAGALTLQHGGIITSANQGRGAGGDITVTTRGPLLIDAADIGFTGISASTVGPSGGGNIAVTVNGQLTIGGSSPSSFAASITSSTERSGNAGNVSVSAQSIVLLNTGSITSDSSLGASGSGGVVSVSAAGSILIETTSDIPAISATGIAAQGDPGSAGNAGDVEVVAGSLSIRGGGTNISSEADGLGAAGAVTVTVSGPIVLDGAGGAIGSTAITAGAAAPSLGRAGQVTVNGGSLTLSNGAFITSANLGAGQGGDLVVRSAGALLLDGALTAIVASTEGAGSGGSVSVSASQITVQNGAQIASSSFASGNGGSVNVSATDSVTLIGSLPEIAATAGASGNAGAISVAANSLLLHNGASISTEALTANGGDIALSIQYLMYLQQSSITTTVDGSKGNGGNIIVDPRYTILKDSVIQANAFGGNGGNINITANQFIATPDSIVEATSAEGINGDITIRAPSDTVTAALANPNRRIAPPTVSNDCAGLTARSGQSTVTPSGRGALPENGTGMQFSHYFLGHPPASVPPLPQFALNGLLDMRVAAAAAPRSGGCP